MIAIIDYGMGNLRAVYNAVHYLGEDAVITGKPDLIDRSSHIILPGVGSFGEAMNNLRSRDLVECLTQQFREKGKPILGVCLGMQLMAGESEEHGLHQGLGWIDATVNGFDREAMKTLKLKVPHVGWNDLFLLGEHRIFSGLKQGELIFYFVHSYHMVCRNRSSVLAESEYGQLFTAAVVQDNLVGTQFHPEKSQDSGIKLLENFVRWRV